MITRHSWNVILGGAGLLGLIGSGHGQPAPVRPVFEVASVRLNVSNPPAKDYIPHRSGNRVSMRNGDLASIVAWAYGLTNRGYQLVAGRWEKDLWEDYDIEALAPGQPGENELRRMFQALLEDRFHFAAHWETRDLPSYDLVRIQGSPKLTAAPPRQGKSSIGFGGSSCWVEITKEGSLLVGKGASMEELAAKLSERMRAPVRERTGLPGTFDFGVPFSTGLTESSAPVLTTAIRDLGLKLEKSRGEFQVLVVDDLGKLSEN